jgi:hypothetical protein
MENNKASNHMSSSDIFTSNDFTTILYNIFHQEIHSSSIPLQDEDYKLTSQGKYRELNTNELNFIPTNAHADFNLRSFFDTETNLYNRFHKIFHSYRHYFKEPFRKDYKHNYIIHRITVGTGCILSIYYLFQNKNLIAGIIFSTTFMLSIYQNWTDTKLRQNLYRSMFDMLPQDEVEKRIKFLEDNKKLNKTI